MPVLDGFAATAAIRKRELQQPNIPRQNIVALTANALQGDRERCLNAGMNDYLTKPINSATLKSCLRKWLEETEDTEGSDQASVESADDTAPSPDNEVDISDLPMLDSRVFNELRSMCEQASPGFYDSLLEKYIGSANQDLQNLKTAIEKQDGYTLRESAHRLKSSSGNWGGTRVAKLCQTLERSCEEGYVDQADALVDTLHIEVDALIETLMINKRAA